MSKSTILVVEDDTDTREILEYALKSEGFDVVAADNGVCALRALESCQPELIVTDLIMPKMGGAMLIQQLKQRKEFAAIPIVVFSAYGNGNEAKAMASGAAVILRKLRDFPRLVGTINQLLGRIDA
jgi:two-component system alkaline phosphatase synthesis response regulator PhoP